MTDEQLAELEALESAGTPPPWTFAIDNASGTHGGVRGPAFPDGVPGNLVHLGGAPNARLIASMRNALPLLLAEVRHLRRENATLRAACEAAYVELASYVGPGDPDDPLTQQGEAVLEQLRAAIREGER